MEVALNGLMGFEHVNVSQCGDQTSGKWDYGYEYIVAFTGHTGNVDEMTVDTTGCAGSGAQSAWTVRTLQDGKGLRLPTPKPEARHAEGEAEPNPYSLDTFVTTLSQWCSATLTLFDKSECQYF